MSTVTPPPTSKRPLHETTSHNIPLVISPIPVIGKPRQVRVPLDTFTPPDSRKKLRPEIVLPSKADVTVAILPWTEGRASLA